MWNEPSGRELSGLPALYASERQAAAEKIIYMHFFFGSSDWYAAEFDGDDTFFGFAVLNGDLQNAEWGYFSLAELKAFNFCGFEVDRDLHWEPIPTGSIERLRGWL